KRIPVGIWPGGTVFNAAGNRAYVANNKTNDISVIDVATLKVVATIDVGIHPDGMGFCRTKG
ncbi:MAG: YncE family protein, partial [Chloroflexi bacterium]|nr:YncE family protein [Chloroflexota bacterium]